MIKQPATQMPVHFWKPIIEEVKDKRQLVNSWEPDTRGWVRADAEAVIISGASRFSFLEKWLGLGPIGKVFILTLFESIRQKERNVSYFSISKMVAAWRPHRSSLWDSGDTECGIIHVLFEKNGGKREICAFSTDISNTDLQAFWKYCSERVGANKLEIRDEKMAHILSNSAKSNESSGGIINEQISDSQSLQADVSKKYGDILRNIDKALDLDSEDPHSWFLRGEALHYLGRNEEAKYSFDQALKRDPENEAIKQFRSKVLSAMGCSENIGNDLILVKNGLWECKNCHIEMLLAGDFCSKCRSHKKDIAIRKE